MGKLADVYVDVSANLKPLNSGLAQAKTALSGFTHGSSFALPITVAMGAGGASLAGLIAGMGEATMKASKLAEATSKVRVTFGGEASGILANVDQLADKFGVVKTEAADVAAQFGMLGKAGGMDLNQQVKFAKEFSQLAIDLASFHDTSRGEAIQKLLSGLEGMPRPLRDFGIFINEAKVKAEAASLGLARYGEELDEEAKLMARISIIRKESTLAQGDAERSLERAGEQFKKFWGELENAQAEFGKQLQSSLKEGILLARQIGELFGKALSKAGITGGNIGGTISTGLNVARFMTAPDWDRGEFVGNALSIAKLQFEKSLTSMFGVSTSSSNKEIQDAIDKLTAKNQEIFNDATKATTSYVISAEDKRKEYWAKIKKEDDEAYNEALLKITPGSTLSNMVAEPLERFQGKLTSWMAKSLNLAGPGTKPTKEFELAMKAMIGRVPEVPRFERERTPVEMLAESPARGVGLAVTGLRSILDAAGGLLAGPGNFIDREKKKFPGLGLKSAEEIMKEERRPSQMFSSPQEFAQQAITGILSGGGFQKEQVELLKDAKTELKSIAAAVNDQVAELKRLLRIPVVPRG